MTGVFDAPSTVSSIFSNSDNIHFDSKDLVKASAAEMPLTNLVSR